MSKLQQNQDVRPSGQNFSFDIALATEYGIEEALLIHHFQHWIRFNKNTGKNLIDGKTWTYQTIKDIAAHFPFLTERQVRYALENLEKKKVLIKGNYNKSAIDKTVWYAFQREDVYVPDLVNSKNVYERQNCPSTDKIVKAIPDTKPTDSLSKKDNVFCKQKKEDVGKSKFPLKKDQVPIYKELKELELDCDDDLLKIIIRDQSKKNGLAFLKDCIHHLKLKIKSGLKIKSKIAFLRNCLSGKQSIVTEKCIRNKEFAEQFVKDLGVAGVEIEDKYIKIKQGNISREIPTLLEEEEFKRKLMEIYRIINPL